MEKNFQCSICYGTGQQRNWSDDGKKVIISDCSYCNGTGYKKYIVQDSRKNSKGKTLDLPHLG
jgi:DnaJ-class molecular chaperone